MIQSARVAPAGFCIFLLDLEPKICEKVDLESLFLFGSSKSLHGFYAYIFLS